MNLMRRAITIASALSVALAFAVGPVSAADPTMTYGRPDLGTGCTPPAGCDDDRSFQAVDKIVPKALGVSGGTTVDFAVNGFHQVAVFPAGTTPGDVAVDPAAFPFVGNGSGTIHLGPPGGSTSFTFPTTPGKYLVICYIAPHFEFTQMWGYVNVR